MKKISIFLFLFVGCTLFGLANNLASLNAKKQMVAYAHLFEVNKEWSHFQAAAPRQAIAFNSDVNRIQYHLRLVADYLETHVAEQLTESQLHRRAELIQALDEYAERKQFPTNLYHAKRTPYFIDDYGIHCAVGYLIAYSGNGDLVKKISAEYNYNYIADIQTEGLDEWAEEYGFSKQELAWIQPGYPWGGYELLPIGNGVNGNILGSELGSDGLYFWGDFDRVDDLPCVQLGVYKDGQLNCLGEGLTGVVNDVFAEEDNIWAAGKLLHNGNEYAVANFLVKLGVTSMCQQ